MDGRVVGVGFAASVGSERRPETRTAALEAARAQCGARVRTVRTTVASVEVLRRAGPARAVSEPGDEPQALHSTLGAAGKGTLPVGAPRVASPRLRGTGRRTLLAELNAGGALDWSRAVIDGSHVQGHEGRPKTGPSPVDRPPRHRTRLRSGCASVGGRTELHAAARRRRQAPRRSARSRGPQLPLPITSHSEADNPGPKTSVASVTGFQALVTRARPRRRTPHPGAPGLGWAHPVPVVRRATEPGAVRAVLKGCRGRRGVPGPR